MGTIGPVADCSAPTFLVIAPLESLLSTNKEKGLRAMTARSPLL
jgi:hypothetical protein